MTLAVGWEDKIVGFPKKWIPLINQKINKFREFYGRQVGWIAIHLLLGKIMIKKAV